MDSKETWFTISWSSYWSFLSFTECRLNSLPSSRSVAFWASCLEITWKFEQPTSYTIYTANFMSEKSRKFPCLGTMSELQSENAKTSLLLRLLMCSGTCNFDLRAFTTQSHQKFPTRWSLSKWMDVFQQKSSYKLPYDFLLTFQQRGTF